MSEGMRQIADSTTKISSGAHQADPGSAGRRYHSTCTLCSVRVAKVAGKDGAVWAHAPRPQVKGH